MRAEIERLARAPKPPPQWIRLGLCEIPSRAHFEWRLRHRQGLLAVRKERRRVRRRAIAERDGWRCGICGQPVLPAHLRIDHIVPLCRGGTSDPSNLQTTHARCNLAKGGR
ncbi:MAG TPA: HNH endonuclease signature motif containing protein [Chloroflexota bacterium]|jgi:5-methylcytosine-specific restriction endonuclease McrA|nr:HNH endonuclease signature motif containing protein [Chloroflexota bacterium]